jgi:hypothetical protein
MQTTRSAIFLLLLSIVTTSCLREQDPGSFKIGDVSYDLQNFDRLEVDGAFEVTVSQSPTYAITIQGDRRNLNDLVVAKAGSTLTIKYNTTIQREHTTLITIAMPELRGASFSGASSSTIDGFKGGEKEMDITLSGASIGQWRGESKRCSINLSGASRLTVIGKSEQLVAGVSGASELLAYDLVAGIVSVDASGASKINVYASQTLNATAGGASLINYKGTPMITSSATGASYIVADN